MTNLMPWCVDKGFAYLPVTGGEDTVTSPPGPHYGPPASDQPGLQASHETWVFSLVVRKHDKLLS